MWEHLPAVATVSSLIIGAVSTVVGSYFLAKGSIKEQGKAIKNLAGSVKDLVGALRVHEKRLDEVDIWRAGSDGRTSKCVVKTESKFNAEIRSMNDEAKEDSKKQWHKIDKNESRHDVTDYRVKTIEDSVGKIDVKLDKILDLIIKNMGE